MGKYNSGKRRLENFKDSAIWKYLHEEVDQMLASELSECYQKKAYVENEQIEDRLSPLLRKSTNCRYYLLSGLTGSGKTTIMRHVFFKDKNIDRPIISNRNLIISFDFDMVIEDDNNTERLFENIFINEISHAAKIVQDRYEIPESTDKEFVEFFTNNSTGLVEYLKNGRRCTNAEIREDLYKRHKLYSMIGELCIALNNEKCRINNVIFIIDNIESLGIDKSHFEIPLLTAHKVINFMCNKSTCTRGKTKWLPNILICCRHSVYRIINTWYDDGSLSQIFESFCLHDEIDLDNPALLKEIIDKRFEIFLDLNQKNKKDSKKQKALSAVHEIVLSILSETTIEERCLLLDLNLSNIRSALQTIREIIYNKKWIQRIDFEDKGVFSIEKASDFNVRLPYILRALGMKCGNIYFSENCLIPNLLKNEQDNNINIYALLSLKYFIQHDSSWTDPIDIDLFYDCVMNIFGEWISENKSTKEIFDKAIWILLKNRIILRSADQEQKELAGITLDNYKSIKYVYVSNVAYDYLYLLKDNSVIFEMLMDDIYIDTKKLPYPSDFKTNFKSFNKGAFYFCLKYLEEILKCEQEIRELFYSRNKSIEFEQAFGQEFVTEILLDGLVQSFEFYFREERVEDKSYRGDCLTLIERIQEKIDNTYRGHF